MGREAKVLSMPKTTSAWVCRGQRDGGRERARIAGLDHLERESGFGEGLVHGFG